MKRNVTIGEWAYLAGLLDGEGSINIIRRKGANGKDYHALRVEITSTNEPVMMWICERFGGTYSSPKPGETNSVMRWRTGAAVAAEVLARIRPFLIIKGVEADIALEYYARTQRWGGNALTPSEIAIRQGYKTRLQSLRGNRGDNKNGHELSRD